VRAESAAVAPADSHVDVIPFPYAPSVALQVPAKEQLRCVLGDLCVVAIEWELGFFGDDRREIVATATKMTSDRTEVPAGPYDDRCLDRFVGDSRIAVLPERCDGRVLEDANVRTSQEEIVELAAPDRVADDARVSRLNGTAADEPCAKRGDLLECQAGGAVVGRREIEQCEDVRRQPAGADLVAREPRSIGHHHVPSRATKVTRAGGSARSAADDQCITADHRWTPRPV